MINIITYHTYLEYINRLYKNQNNTDTEYLKGLFSKRDYYNLLLDVLKMIEKSPNGTNISYRYELFQKSGLKELIYNFVYERNLTPGMVLDFGTELNRDTIVCGRSQEYIDQNGLLIPAPKEMERDTIFDLASTSKLFTTISILKLCEAGLIDLNEPVRKYAPEFKNLDNITIFDLLSFRIPVKTDGRIDTAKSVSEANNRLFTLSKEENHDPTFLYTDMGALALRYVIEHVSNMTLDDFIREEILLPCQMDRTFLNVPQELKNMVANENYSSIVNSDGIITTLYRNVPGTVHDPKANALGHGQGIAPGHAGYFSSSEDMGKLAKGLIGRKLLNNDNTLMIGQKIVGEKVMDQGQEIYSCHHGLLTYTKQPNPQFITVQPFLSGKAFISPGFAGTALCVDPLNEVYAFVGGNRLHNRVYSVPTRFSHNISTNNLGTKTYCAPSGEKKIISSSYTKDCQDLIKLAMKLALQYQLLERILGQTQEMKLVREI